MFSATKESRGRCRGKGEMPSFPHASPEEQILSRGLIANYSLGEIQ